MWPTCCRLKKAKERERHQLEGQAQQFVMTQDPQTEAAYEQQQQEAELQHSMEQLAKQAQKMRETERFGEF